MVQIAFYQSPFLSNGAFYQIMAEGRMEAIYKQGAVAKARTAQLCLIIVLWKLPIQLSPWFQEAPDAITTKFTPPTLAYSFVLAFSDPVTDTIFITLHWRWRPSTLDLWAFALFTTMGPSQSPARNVQSLYWQQLPIRNLRPRTFFLVSYSSSSIWIGSELYILFGSCPVLRKNRDIKLEQHRRIIWMRLNKIIHIKSLTQSQAQRKISKKRA